MAKTKSTLGNKIKTGAKYVAGTAATGGGIEFLSNLLPLLGMKDGGRVRGCGAAKRGFGKAMKRKK
jgi:hypothetical protein